MENMAKLDWKTGRLKLNGVEIRPGMKSEEFRKYGDAVKCKGMGDGYVIIRLKDKVFSNGIYGWVKITMDSRRNSIEVIVHPQTDGGTEPLEASKQWLLGVVSRDQFQYFSELVQAKFSWGYIIAQYYSNKDYNQYGGDVEIIYKG